MKIINDIDLKNAKRRLSEIVHTIVTFQREIAFEKELARQAAKAILEYENKKLGKN